MTNWLYLIALYLVPTDPKALYITFSDSPIYTTLVGFGKVPFTRGHDRDSRGWGSNQQPSGY